MLACNDQEYIYANSDGGEGWVQVLNLMIITSTVQIFVMSRTEIDHKKQWLANGFEPNICAHHRNPRFVSPHANDYTSTTRITR